MEFQFDIELEGKVIVIKIPKNLDMHISEDLKSLLDSFTKKGQYKWVMDLHQTEYVDSSGLGAFVSQIAMCRSNRGDIHLAKPSVFVQSLLAVTHLNKILKSFDDVQSAIDGFR